MITNEDIQRKLREIDDYLGRKYVLEHPPKQMCRGGTWAREST